jgi:hypothetical protein
MLVVIYRELIEFDQIVIIVPHAWVSANTIENIMFSTRGQRKAAILCAILPHKSLIPVPAIAGGLGPFLTPVAFPPTPKGPFESKSKQPVRWSTEPSRTRAQHSHQTSVRPSRGAARDTQQQFREQPGMRFPRALRASSPRGLLAERRFPPHTKMKR